MLALGAVALGPAAVGRAWSPEDALPYSVIGWTQGGLEMRVHHLGDAPTRIFLLGGHHGGPEINTVNLVRYLIEHFVDRSHEIPAHIGLDFMVMGNPDGVAINSRQYLSGVDPNRNWPTPDWNTDAWDSNARFVRGLGGPEPMSEQETRALADWLQTYPPILLINYHSAGGFMFGGRDGIGGEMAQAYESGSRYFRSGGTPQGTGGGGGTPGGGGSGLLPYRATGSMNPWLRMVGINGIFIELTTPYTAEFTRNLAGLHAVFDVLRQYEFPAPSADQ